MNKLDTSTKEDDFPRFAEVMKTDLIHLYCEAMEEKDPILVGPPEPTSNKRDHVGDFANEKTFTDQLCSGARYTQRITT